MITKEDFEVFDKHLDKDNSYKSLGNGRWYNAEMYEEFIRNTNGDEVYKWKSKYFRLQTFLRYFAFVSVLTIGLLILWKM